MKAGQDKTGQNKRRTSNIEHRTFNVERFGVSFVRCSMFNVRCSMFAFPRRGLSLLEVLFTIFVLAVGLLGLASLLTGGHSHFSQGEQADRSAACGRAAQRDIEAHDMLRYSNWRWVVDTSGSNWTASEQQLWGRFVQANGINTFSGTNNAYLAPFVIDPLFVAAEAANGQAEKVQWFPYTNATPPAPASETPLVTAIPRLPRFTLADAATTKLFDGATADQWFTSRDDLRFEPRQRDARPDLMLERDPSNSPTLSSIAGDYSWMVMVTPAEAENYVPGAAVLGSNPPEQGGLRLDQRRLFTATVVVFYKRDARVETAPPTERQALATVLGPHSILVSENLGSLTSGRWIMLSAVLKPPLGENPPPLRPLHRWYRIASVGQGPTKTQVLLNLTGPDWSTGQTTSPYTDVHGDTCHAVVTVVDKVVGVFERTVELDVRSLSTQ
jgi:hypothetical protein